MLAMLEYCCLTTGIFIELCDVLIQSIKSQAAVVELFRDYQQDKTTDSALLPPALHLCCLSSMVYSGDMWSCHDCHVLRSM